MDKNGKLRAVRHVEIHVYRGRCSVKIRCSIAALGILRESEAARFFLSVGDKHVMRMKQWALEERKRTLSTVFTTFKLMHGSDNQATYLLTTGEEIGMIAS